MIEQNKIPGNSTEIKENSTWHKVDLSNKKVKHHEDINGYGLDYFFGAHAKVFS